MISIFEMRELVHEETRGELSEHSAAHLWRNGRI